MITIFLGPTWLNGRRLEALRAPDSEDAEHSSSLLSIVNADRKQCCIGVALTQLGVPDEHLMRHDQAPLHYVDQMDPAHVPEPLHWLLKSAPSVTKDLPIYETNDQDVSISDAERVAALNAISEPHGIHFELSDASHV